MKNKVGSKKGKKQNFFKSLVGLVNGNALAREEFVVHLPYMMFLALIALMYIINGYWAEGAVREINRSSVELKEMRSEYITTKSDLMYISKQSKISGIVAERKLGLKESYTPPKKIVVKSQENSEVK
ncbi:MAG: hypothetical protein JKY42_07185 [Flavobacteriales bacterium]|nr:hypothetical protein [Flavobacteriales bacterium]